jgi:hypothetical protein
MTTPAFSLCAENLERVGAFASEIAAASRITFFEPEDCSPDLSVGRTLTIGSVHQPVKMAGVSLMSQ